MAYATRTDLARIGVKADMTASVEPADLDAMLSARSRFADGYLATGGYTLPMVSWDDDLRLCVAQLAAWDAMSANVGIQPDQQGDTTWRDRRDEALAWLKDIGARRARLVNAVDSTAALDEGGPDCQTEEPRGW